MSDGIVYRPATIASGESASGVQKAARPVLRRILVPAGTQGETLVLFAAVSENSPTFLLRDDNQRPIRFFFKAGGAAEIDPARVGHLTYAAVGTRDQSGEVEVEQSAGRAFQLGWAEA